MTQLDTGPRPIRDTTKVAPTRLASIAHYFPGEPIGNDYFESLDLGIDDAWIREHTGIVSRHWPDPQRERPVEMAANAVAEALDRAELEPGDVELVIGTTSTTRPRANPSTLTNRYMDISVPLQSQANLVNAACFDVQAVACAGFLYAGAVASSMMAGMGYRNALVVCAENPQPILNFDYKYSALFGGGAAAAVLTPARDDTDSPTSSQILDIVLHADGTYFDAFDIDDNDKMIMKGKEVGKQGPRLLCMAARELLERNSLNVEDVDWFIPHQGNLTMIDKVVAELGASPERTLTNIQRRGNTSSVSMPSCLSENLADDRIQPGDLVALFGIGRGFSWGGMLLRA